MWWWCVESGSLHVFHKINVIHEDRFITTFHESKRLVSDVCLYSVKPILNLKVPAACDSLTPCPRKIYKSQSQVWAKLWW